MGDAAALLGDVMLRMLADFCGEACRELEKDMEEARKEKEAKDAEDKATEG